MKRKYTEEDRIIRFYTTIYGDEGKHFSSHNIDKAKSYIHKYFKTLGSIYPYMDFSIVKARFGVDSEYKRINELARERGVSNSKIKKIEEETILKLMSPEFDDVGSSILFGEIYPFSDCISLSKNDLLTDISELQFSVRSEAILRRNNVNTIEELLKSRDKLHTFRNLGKKSLREIEDKLNMISYK